MANKRLIREIFLLLGASVGIAFFVNLFSPVGIALVGQWDSSRGVIGAKGKIDIIVDNPEIDDVITAKQIYDSGSALFVDARSAEDFADGHIPGAISMPVSQFDGQIDDFMDRHPENQPIVTYCSGRTCEDSHKLARLLIDFGYKDVKVFIDGYPGWQAERFPVE